MASRIPNLTLVAPDQSGKEYTINHALNALSPSSLFGRRDAECTGLNWYYYGGFLCIDGVFTFVDNNSTPLQLSASKTNYVYATRGGVVAASISGGFPAGSIPLYIAVCGVSTVTDYSDVRQAITLAGQISIGSASAGSGDVNLSWEQASLDYLSITGTLTANRSVIVPNVWRGTISNETTGAFSLTVKTAGGTGVVVGQGEVGALLADGANVVAIGGGGGGTSGAAILAGQAGGQKLIGGLAASDMLQLQATSGAASTGEGITFLVGDAGGTKAIAVLHDGKVQISSSNTNGLLNVGGTVFASNSTGNVIHGESSGDGTGVYGKSTGDGTGVLGRATMGVAGRFNQIGDLTANCSTSVLSVSRALTGGYNVSGDVVVVDDSPSVTGSVSGMLFRGYCDGSTRVSLNPRVADGASAVAHFLSTATLLSNSGAKLLAIRNQGTERFAVKASGRLVLTTPNEYADDSAAATGGIAVGEVYRTGSVLKVRVA